jgi:hypothetical protein
MDDLRRKIEPRERAMERKRSGIVGAGGILCARVVAKRSLIALWGHYTGPETVSCPCDSLEALAAPVAHVLRMGASAEIPAAIVKRVAVHMIHHKPRERRADDETLQ